jgi:hypothetical protein
VKRRSITRVSALEVRNWRMLSVAGDGGAGGEEDQPAGPALDDRSGQGNRCSQSDFLNELSGCTEYNENRL